MRKISLFLIGGFLLFGASLFMSCDFLDQFMGSIGKPAESKDPSSEKSIVTFSFLKVDNPDLNENIVAVVLENDRTITWSFPLGTDISALVPTVVLSQKATVSPASRVKRDFTVPLSYVVSAEDGSTAQYTVTVTATSSYTSPTDSVYTTVPPVLNYSSPHTVLLTLNGTQVSVANNGVLITSRTGMNRLVGIEQDAAGNIFNTVTVDYFLNDLIPADSEDFASASNQVVGDSWNGWSVFSTAGIDPEIIDNTIAIRGSTSIYGWGGIDKAYNSVVDSKCIQAIDVLTLANQTAYSVVGFIGDPGEMMGVQLVKTPSGYDLFLTESSLSLIPSPNYVVVGNSTLSPILTGQAIQLYFYRNATSYQALAANLDDMILANIIVPSYTSVLSSAGKMNARGFLMAPYDTTSSSNIIVQVDNYRYFH